LAGVGLAGVGLAGVTLAAWLVRALDVGLLNPYGRGLGMDAALRASSRLVS
jgi:hypothetical protein